jgi:flavin reductase (DIM6/NTAB) family NADH-FMN oxidoreductase RutF
VTAPPPPPEVVAAVQRLDASRLFLLTAEHDGARAGVIVRWAQRCSEASPLLCVAAPTGRTTAPLIRDSRVFGLCEVPPTDRLLIHKFSSAEAPDEQEDPFASLRVRRLKTGAPILAGSPLALDCEVAGHIDLETDHELYIGLVVAAAP